MVIYWLEIIMTKNGNVFNFSKASRHCLAEITGIRAGATSTRHSFTEAVTLGFVIVFVLMCLFMMVHGCDRIPIVPSAD